MMRSVLPYLLAAALIVADVTGASGHRVRDCEIEIGAAVTLTDAEEVLAAHYPDLGELLRRFASPPIRNVATLGGNIANASPIGDSMPALIAIGAASPDSVLPRKPKIPSEEEEAD